MTKTAVALALCLVVVIARIVLALTTPAPEVILDAAGYEDAARRLATHGYYAWVYAGDNVSDPVPNAMHLPGYPAALAALFSVFGPDTPVHPMVSVAQAVLSGLTIFGVFLIGRAVSCERIGLLATVIAGAYLPFWWSYRHVLTEDLFMALCVWGVWLLLVAFRSDGARFYTICACAGVVAAAATYVRATGAICFMLVGLAALALSGERRVRLLRGGLVALLVVLVAFVPWWYRNARIYNRFVPLNTMTAAGSLISSFPTESEAFELLGTLQQGHLDPPADIEVNHKIAAIARARTLEELSTNPFTAVWRRARLLAISALTYHPNPFGGFRGMGAVTEAVHLAVVAMAAVGLWRRRRQIEAWLVAAVPLALVAVHSITLVYSRYLFPMMPFLIVLAAVGISGIAQRSNTIEQSAAATLPPNRA